MKYKGLCPLISKNLRRRSFLFLSSDLSSIVLCNRSGSLESRTENGAKQRFLRMWTDVRKYRVVLDEINMSSSPLLQPLKLLANYLLQPAKRDAIVVDLDAQVSHISLLTFAIEQSEIYCIRQDVFILKILFSFFIPKWGRYHISVCCPTLFFLSSSILSPNFFFCFLSIWIFLCIGIDSELQMILPRVFCNTKQCCGTASFWYRYGSRFELSPWCGSGSRS